MRWQIACASALALFCALNSAAMAQDTLTAGSTTPAAAGVDNALAESAPAQRGCCILPVLTTVELEILDAASSRSSKPGDKVRIRVAEPVTIDGRAAIAAGTEGFAEVIQASKAALMGKAGELTLGAPYVEVDGHRISLKRLRYGPSQGSDPSGTLNALNVAAAVALPVASVALIFVSGGNIDVKPGARAHAVTAAETFIPTE